MEQPNQAYPSFSPLGEEGVIVVFGDAFMPETQREVAQFSRALAAKPFPGFVEHVPAYVSVCVYFDVDHVASAFETAEQGERPYEAVVARLQELLLSMSGKDDAAMASERPVKRVPVCYCPACGPDLGELAKRCGMARDEAARLHSSASYTVAMLGFLPGFPYMSGLPPALAAPRLNTPRPLVPMGSVGIAGRSTGIYPSDSPGGWRLIGRTNVRLFQPEQVPPSYLENGDAVAFVPLSHAELFPPEPKGEER